MSSSAPSIPELLRVELEELQVPAPASVLLVLAGVGRGSTIPPQRMGRIMDYERERYERTREVPRLAVALAPDGTAARPSQLALGSWRLARRLITPDAARGHAAALGIRLCERAVRVRPALATALIPAAMEAASIVLGAEEPFALEGPSDWERLRSKLLAARPGGGADAITAQQYAAEERLHEAQLRGNAVYFGAHVPLRGRDAPRPAVRLPLAGEAGKPFDDLVRERADSETAREVLAFVQEWGWLVDSVEEPVSPGAYAARWGVPEDEVHRRLDRFRRILPTENDPTALWHVLWDGAAKVPDGGAGGTFIRLTGVRIVEDQRPDLVTYFLMSVVDQVGGPEPAMPLLRADRNGLLRRPGGRARAEWRVLAALADIVVHRWTRTVLAAPNVAAGDWEAGLAALGPLHDRKSFSQAEQWLGAVRVHLPQGPARQALLDAQRCLRWCAAVPTDEDLRSEEPLRPGIRLAAGVLAAAARMGVVDLAAETQLAFDALGGGHG